MAAIPVTYNNPFAESADDELRTLQKILAGVRACTHAAAVTPNDSTDLAHPGFLWVGGAGNISLITAGGETVLISAIAAGTFLPLAVTRVRASTTTATLILVFY